MTAAKTPTSVCWLLVLLIGTASGTDRSRPGDALAKAPEWQPPKVEDVRARALIYLEENLADAAVRARAVELWSNLSEQPSESDLLLCLAKTFALADENAGRLVELCSQPKSQLVLPSQVWLSDPQTPPLVADNLRLLYGRWLVHQSLFDEALGQLRGLRPADVAAPASLLFYQGVAHHSLLEKEAGLEAIGQLLAGADASPRRYVAVARLMQEDLSALEDDTLDHIARRMGDIRRRLDLGRAGKRVRKVEDGVIESLDKLIKKIEQQQQQQQQQSGGSSDNIRSQSPAPDSRIIGGKGRGDVTKRNIGSKSGWGDLPPKQREEALQRIGRDFPSHYRDVIEQYFRRLAAEGSE